MKDFQDTGKKWEKKSRGLLTVKCKVCGTSWRGQIYKVKDKGLGKTPCPVCKSTDTEDITIIS